MGPRGNCWMASRDDHPRCSLGSDGGFETRAILVSAHLGQILHQVLAMESLATSNMQKESLTNSSSWGKGYPYLTASSMSAFDVFTSADERQGFFGGSWTVSAFEGIGAASGLIPNRS